VWQWESLSIAADPGLPLTAAELDSGSSAEAGRGGAENGVASGVGPGPWRDLGRFRLRGLD